MRGVVTERVCRALGMNSGSAALDIVKALEMICHARFLPKLNWYVVSGRILYLIQSYPNCEMKVERIFF